MTTPINGKKNFGPGRAFATLNATNPTPARMGLVQDISLSCKGQVKEIFGEKQFAADVRRGTLSLTGKVTYGASNPRLWADSLLESTLSAGQLLEADNESGTVPGTSTYIITVANAGTFVADAGVIDVATGKRMVRVAAASEVAGTSYSLNAATGVYTFAAGDANKVKKISYSYTQSGGNGVTATITNPNQGENSNFAALLVFPWNGEQDVVSLANCVGSDADMSSKNSDFGKPTFGFTSACDTSDTLGTFSWAEAA